jgi:Long-chain fatty acid transport protein
MTLSGASLAAGFALNDHSATASGNALAGAAASNTDMSYSFWNPALFTNAKKTSIYVSGAYLLPEMDVTVNSATKRTGETTTTDITSDGKPSGDIVDETIIPALYFAIPFKTGTVLGVSLNAPFGLSGEYGDDWAGRYHSAKTGVQDIALSFSIAQRLTKWASIGASTHIHQANVRLDAAVTDLGLGTGDGYGKLEGDDVALSYSVGFMLEPLKGTRFGVGYRSEIDFTFEGDAEYSNIDPTVESTRDIENAYLYDELTFPSVLSIGLEQDFGSKFKLGISAIRTGWSSLDEMRIKFGEGQNPGRQGDSVLTFDFEDQWFYSIGVSYDVTENLTLRTGIAKDYSPVKDEYRSARTPDGDRDWVSVGGTYRFSPDTSLVFAYTHVEVEDVNLNRTGSLEEDYVRGALNADYKSSAEVISLALNMAF